MPDQTQQQQPLPPPLPVSQQPTADLQSMLQARAPDLAGQQVMLQALRQRMMQRGMQMQTANPYLQKMWRV
jgi:hypothetical protein